MNREKWIDRRGRGGRERSGRGRREGKEWEGERREGKEQEGEAHATYHLCPESPSGLGSQLVVVHPLYLVAQSEHASPALT